MPIMNFAHGTRGLNTDMLLAWEDDGTTLTMHFQGGQDVSVQDPERLELLGNRNFAGGRLPNKDDE